MFVLDHVSVTDCPSVIGVVGATLSVTIGGEPPLLPVVMAQEVRVRATHTYIARQKYRATWSEPIESLPGWAISTGSLLQGYQDDEPRFANLQSGPCVDFSPNLRPYIFSITTYPNYHKGAARENIKRAAISLR